MTARIGRTAAAVAFSLLPRLPGQETAPYVEHELFSLTEPAVTFSRKLPLAEGDGEVEVEVVAQVNPETELKVQPGGWWHYLEFQNEDGRYHPNIGLGYPPLWLACFLSQLRHGFHPGKRQRRNGDTINQVLGGWPVALTEHVPYQDTRVYCQYQHDSQNYQCYLGSYIQNDKDYVYPR